jgi:hypothetical protein
MNCRTPPMIHTPPPVRPRNERLEAEIVATALHALPGVEDDGGLSRYAAKRTLPGGIRTNQDWRDHARQELGDCRNYLVWDTEDHWDGYQANDPDAAERVAENLCALALLVKLWAGLPGR